MTNHQPYLPTCFTNPGEAHIAALHQSLIPNWTSPAFAKFVDACRSVVDDLANAQTTGNGKDEMMRCDNAFRQVIWLWEKTWPDPETKSAQEEDADTQGAEGMQGAEGDADADGDEDDDDESIVEVNGHGGVHDGPSTYMSPYGGTGLQAVEAAVRAG